MGLSGLNFHRKKVRFINNASCGHCGHRKEDPYHYFFACPAFAALRLDLFRNLNAIEDFSTPLVADLTNKKVAENFLNILLYGTNNIEMDINIFNSVHDYISYTHRFM